MNTKTSLLGLSLAELKDVAKRLGMPAFTGGQMAKWLYGQHVKSIDEMTNISKANREKLAGHYTIGCASPIDEQRSKDGTVKYLFPVTTTAVGENREAPVKFVETVYIPDKDLSLIHI